MLLKFTVPQVKTGTLITKYTYDKIGRLTRVNDQTDLTADATGTTWMFTYDLGGNIYKQVALQDATGGVIVAVNQNGLSGYLAVGQEILVSLKGLHIGGYGKMAEIGAPYNGSIGRMNKDIWASHFKIIGGINSAACQPVEFSPNFNKDNDAVKLVVFRGVSFTDANGKNTFATSDATTNRKLKEYSVIVRTSNYADFAGDVLPSGKVNLTGILTRFNNDWQLLIRTADDIQLAN